MWKRFVDWWYGLFRKPEEDELEPDTCQCGHARCSHEKGRYKSHVYFVEGPAKGRQCACQIFIKKGGRGKGSSPVTPSVDELERMFNR